MGIYLPNMEMPKNCKECMFADFDDVDFDYELYCTVNGKYADLDMYNHPMGWNCPLVEIPTPHGRLIDADKFKADYSMKNDCTECEKELRGSSRSCEYDRIYSKMDFCGWLDDAEVVIEAEGSEE